MKGAFKNSVTKEDLEDTLEGQEEDRGNMVPS